MLTTFVRTEFSPLGGCEHLYYRMALYDSIIKVLVYLMFALYPDTGVRATT